MDLERRDQRESEKRKDFKSFIEDVSVFPFEIEFEFNER